jgi:selenocysteine lyase/cysteine desulfurase
MMARKVGRWLDPRIGRGIAYRMAPTTTRRASSPSSPDGYQSIGSFHSENLAVLMSLPDEQYAEPKLPFEGEEKEGRSNDGISPSGLVGGDVRRDDFLLDPAWTFLNHGAFGGALRVGYDRAEAWRRHLERQPLRFFDRDLLPHLAHTGRILSRLVGADPPNVALLPNVTSGLNAVLAGYARAFPRSNVILMDTTYGSVKKMVKCYFDSNSSGTVVVHEIPLQTKHLSEIAESSPGQVLERLLLRKVEQCRGKPTLVLLDHTTSNTALTFPVERLARRAKELHDQLCVVVDGAHGLLAQDVNVAEMRSVDVYLTNAHKWLSAPRGAAFLHAMPDVHSTLLRQPAVISHGVDEPDLFSRFVWDGCRDYAAALSIPAVVQYWEETGVEQVRNRMKERLQHGIRVLASHWHPEHSHPDMWAGTVTLTRLDDDSDCLSPMALVALPFPSERTSADAFRIQNQLYEMKIEVPVKCINAKLYVRVSCHVYNQLEEFERLARAISNLRM